MIDYIAVAEHYGYIALVVFGLSWVAVFILTWPIINLDLGFLWPIPALNMIILVASGLAGVGCLLWWLYLKAMTYAPGLA